jgi:hypothetical protein
MTGEDRLLVLCARQDFLDAHRAAVEDLVRREPVSWDRLEGMARSNGVLPIVGANLRRCSLDLPEGFGERLEAAVFENAIRKEQDALALAGSLARLREAGLEALLLKGTALDLLVYTEPWVVTSRDTDLLLRPLPGYRPGPAEKAVRRALYRAGIEADLLTHHDVDMHGVLPVSFERIWRAARRVDYRGAEAWVMSPEDLLISICVNACRKRFFRLKGLFDLAETVRRLPVSWPELGRRARDGRCEGIVLTALLAARATVGCELPEGALGALGVSRVRARLLRLLVAGALRTLSFDNGERAGLALLLPYASFRAGQFWLSFYRAVTHPSAPRALPEPSPPEPSAILLP